MRKLAKSYLIYRRIIMGGSTFDPNDGVAAGFIHAMKKEMSADKLGTYMRQRILRTCH